MAQQEKTGTRDLTYSAWHRVPSMQRFVGSEIAALMKMIDVDVPIYVEYPDGTREPLFICEVARFKNEVEYKTATVTRRLAKKAGIPAFTVLYQCNDKPMPGDTPYLRDIQQFWIRQEHPSPANGYRFHRYSPQRWAEYVRDLRGTRAQIVDLEIKREHEAMVCPICKVGHVERTLFGLFCNWCRKEWKDSAEGNGKEDL